MIRSNLNKLKAINYKRAATFAIAVFLLVCLIFCPDLVFFLKNGVYNYAIAGIIIVTMLLLVPIVLFSYNLKIYYYILAFIAALTPIAVLPVFLINSLPNTEMLGLVLETNSHEAMELMGWKMLIVPLIMIAFFVAFLLISKRLPRKVNFKKAALISLVSLCCFLVIPFLRSTALVYYVPTIKNTFKAYYPFRIGDAISYMSSELKNVDNYKKTVANFSFDAKETKKDSARKITILVIGETARYDHWSINGYNRETSPNLAKQQNLITFSDVSSSGPMTHLSIPLIITRADATDYDMHKQERSVLGAYKECGYKTFWISNQSKYGLTGNIGMHYNDADTTIFDGWGSNENNYKGSYDSCLLPAINNVIDNNKSRNIFILVHTIGSHWRYLLRYPTEFTKFQPVSDRNRTLVGYPPDNIMINEYDNSILYTDYILNQIIEIVKSKNAESSVTYVSDHGENLNDNNNHLYFHSLNPTKYTAHVPLFIWTSNRYKQANPDKFQNLESHKSLPISSGANVFFTLLDMSHISIKQESNDKKSIASDHFKGDPQLIIDENGKPVPYKSLK